MSLVNSKFSTGSSKKVENETSVQKQNQQISFGSGLLAENMFDIAKIFNRETHMQQQIPFDILCANEINLHFNKRKGNPFVHSEAKVSMALYQKWVFLKNGGSKGEVKTTKVTDLQPVTIDKENVDPNNAAKVSPNPQTFEEFKKSFQDKSIPVELNSGSLIKFLIEDTVKQCFKEEMTKRLSYEQKD